MVAFASSATGGLLPLEFTVNGQLREIILPATVSVTGAETNVAIAKLGLGLIQVPRYRLGEALARGELVEILRDFPPSPSPVYVLYPHSRQLSPRVRVFIDWLSTQFTSQN
jgi:DNA-binding transcriptional LysR family regulator